MTVGGAVINCAIKVSKKIPTLEYLEFNGKTESEGRQNYGFFISYYNSLHKRHITVELSTGHAQHTIERIWTTFE